MVFLGDREREVTLVRKARCSVIWSIRERDSCKLVMVYKLQGASVRAGNTETNLVNFLHHFLLMGLVFSGLAIHTGPTYRVLSWSFFSSKITVTFF